MTICSAIKYEVKKAMLFLMVMENCRREILMHTRKNKEKKNVIYDSLVLI